MTEDRTIVRCKTCGTQRDISIMECLAEGWPKCCGETMPLNPTEPRKFETAMRKTLAKYLMEHDPLWEPKAIWYKGCVEQSCKYPMGSFLYTFWWSLRMELGDEKFIKLWANDPAKALENWLLYFQFKWEQLANHRDHHGKLQGNEETDHLKKERPDHQHRGLLRGLARFKGEFRKVEDE